MVSVDETTVVTTFVVIGSVDETVTETLDEDGALEVIVSVWVAVDPLGTEVEELPVAVVLIEVVLDVDPEVNPLPPEEGAGGRATTSVLVNVL
jgi:hypothetical protein